MKPNPRKPIHINVPDHVRDPELYIHAARLRITNNARKTWIAKTPRFDEIETFLNQNDYNDFYHSLLVQLDENGKLSDKQTAIVLKAIDKKAERATAWEKKKTELHKADVDNSTHIGVVGKRVELDLTLSFVTSFDAYCNYSRSNTTRYIYNFKDADGNVVIYKGSSELGLDICFQGNYCFDDHSGYVHKECRDILVKKGGRVTLKGTIKKHDEYKGVKQTIVSRPAVSSITTERGIKFNKNDVVDFGDITVGDDVYTYFDRNYIRFL